MNWEARYLPPDPTIWQGHPDIPADSCFYHIMKPINLFTDKLEKQDKLAFALIGFKSDEGVQRDLGRTGAFEGPTAIRHRLAKLPVQRPDIVCYDIGNIVCTDHDLEASQAALGVIISELIALNIRPIVIGGGHELAWGHFQGINNQLPHDKRLGIINFDAHFDIHRLQPTNRGSSRTAFYQIAEAHKKEKRHFDYNCIGIQHTANVRQLFDLAKKLKVNLIFADEMHQGLQEKCIDFVDRVIDENDLVYLSISLDVFSAAFAPGVSSIQPLGLNPWHVIPLIRQAASSGKVKNYDIAEHVPRYDIDHRTAKLAAMLIYEIIHHHNEPANHLVEPC